MNSLVKFALLSERLYQDMGGMTTDEWLKICAGGLWLEAESRDITQAFAIPVLDLKLDHVGALVRESVPECRAMLDEHGYTDIVTKPSVVVAGMLGVPVTIVEGRLGAYRVELFCPERRGLAWSKRLLVNNWGRLGYGVHVGFVAPDRDKLFEVVRELCSAHFIAPNWVKEMKALEPQLLCYLDGFIEKQRIRVEVCWC